MTNKPIKAHVDLIAPLTDSILQLILAPEQFRDYQAGQYLQILTANHEALSYSIANAPLGSRKYELHIRHSPENPYHQSLFAQIKQQGKVSLRVPLGDCHLNKLNKNQPILFIVGGTGFAPAKAMIEQLLATGDQRRFELYWGARSQSDLYMDEKVKLWQTHVGHFRYFSLLSSASKETLAALACDHHVHDLLDWQVVLAGPFDMVFAMRDTLIAYGLPDTQLFSDAFSFNEPRK